MGCFRRGRGVAAHPGYGRDSWNVGGHVHRDFHYSGYLLFGGKVHDEIQQETYARN